MDAAAAAAAGQTMQMTVYTKRLPVSFRPAGHPNQTMSRDHERGCGRGGGCWSISCFEGAEREMVVGKVGRAAAAGGQQARQEGRVAGRCR